MKRYLLFSALLFLLLATLSCSGEKGEATNDKPAAAAAQASPSQPAGPIFRSLPPREAQLLMQSRKDLLVIDVRSLGELREGFIEGSRFVPMGDLARGRATLPAGHPLLLVCAVGGRSYAVGQYFSRNGYMEIYNLQGGIDAWKRSGLPLRY